MISVTVDAVIFAPDHDSVLLIKRKNPPFQGSYALPGGFLEEKETLEQAAYRELKEETGLDVGVLYQVGAFGSPWRDPRGYTVTIAFTGRVAGLPEVLGADDADLAEWVSLDKIFPQKIDLAFDHGQIIDGAYVAAQELELVSVP